jgi:UDP-2,3-diacylglucosamine hydrolase
MQKAYFASDLHLLTSRSRGEQALSAIRRHAREASMFVLGGDIFDFRWATTPTTEAAVELAVAQLGELVRDCPQCSFHYLLGNHDYHQPFIEPLRDLTAATDNLLWHRFHLRSGPSAFLHGDVADGWTDAQQLAVSRQRWLYDRKRSPVRSGLYDFAVGLRLHKPVLHLAYPRRKVARRILAYLNHVGLGPDQGVRNVYFGHTHRPVEGFAFQGLTFHNGGAAIEGLDFQILEADVSC